MKNEKIADTRKQLKWLTILVSPAVGGMVFLAFRIAFQSSSIVLGMVALLIAAGFVSFLFGLRRWAAYQEPLLLFENGLVPMVRPAEAAPGRILLIDAIARIDVQSMKGSETLSFAYKIWDKEGRRYGVTARLVYRYDQSLESLAQVYAAMESLRKRVEARNTPA